MAINFPTSPANGTTVTSGGKTWQYSSATTSWSIVTDPAQIQSITTTATSGGTTVLDSSANYHQFFTGSSTHTLTLPVVSTLSLGQYYMVHNNSTGILTVRSSGLNTILSMPGNTTAKFTVILTSGTTAASWDADYQGFTNITGSGAAVLATVTSASSGQVLQWNGSTWINAGAAITVSDTAPVSPVAGQLWFDSENIKTYIYYDSFWVEIGATSATSSLDDIGDVQATLPTTGHYLQWNGSIWTSASVSVVWDDEQNILASRIFG